MACYRSFSWLPHPLTAWGLKKVPELAGVCAVHPGSGLKVVRTVDGEAQTTGLPCCDRHQETAQGYQEVSVGVAVVQ